MPESPVVRALRKRQHEDGARRNRPCQGSPLWRSTANDVKGQRRDGAAASTTDDDETPKRTDDGGTVRHHRGCAVNKQTRSEA